MKTNDLNPPIIGGDPELQAELAAIQQSTSSSSEPIDTTVPQDRRQDVRYDRTVVAAVYPVAASLEVDAAARIDGIVVDISRQGLGLRVDSQRVKVGDHLLIGVETGSTATQYASITVRGITTDGLSSSCLQTSFLSPWKPLFEKDIIYPEFDAKTFQYGHEYPENVLLSLTLIGAIEATIVDTVLVCPECQSIPTIRHGCSACLSHDMVKSRMIHHFACAHVDFVERFEHREEIVCPKCRGRKMIVGADYEYLDGPIQCRECGHNDLQEILIGHCMRCAHRFPMDHAVELEIEGYRVNRLDPLALVRQN